MSSRNPLFRFSSPLLKVLALLLIAILSSCSKNNQDVLEQINFSYQVCIDPEQKHSIEDWKSIPFETTKDLKLGFYRGAIWMKFIVKNNSDEQNTIVIKNEDVFNRNYKFYEYDSIGSSVKRVAKEYDLAFRDDRSFNSPNPNFKITLAVNEERIFYQHITSDGRVIQVTPSILSLTDYVDGMNSDSIWNFSFYGIILIILLINFIYWRMFKNKIYFFYTFYVLSSIIFYAGLEGYLFGLGIQNHLIDHLVFICLNGLILFFLFFSCHFLSIYTISSKFMTILKYYASLFIVLMVYQIVFFKTSISYLHEIYNYAAASSMLMVLFMLVLAIKSKRYETKFYLAALLSYLIFLSIGIIDSHLDLFSGSYKNYYKIGFITEVVIFTFTVVIILAKGDNRRVELEVELKNSNKAKEETLKRLLDLKDENESFEAVISQIKEEKIEKTDLLAIFKLLESNLSEEDDWLSFKRKFEELNPNFLPKLHKKHPDLSKTEIRLLTLVKIGFSQKEIAKVLYIAEDSVKKAKQRVRKKMRISPEVALPEYLLNLK